MQICIVSSMVLRARELPNHPHPPPLLTLVLEVNLHALGGKAAVELFAPLDEDDGVLVPEVVEAEGLELRDIVQPVEVDVVDLRVAAVFVDQGEGGAGD